MMPMQRRTIPMSMSEFETMAHTLGWKHEYWDGAAQLSINHSAVATLRRETSLPVEGGHGDDVEFQIRPMTTDDFEALVRLQANAFQTTPDYCGYSESDYEQSIRRELSYFYEDVRGHDGRNASLRSCVVVHNNQLVSALIIRARKSEPTIQPIMVDPRYQRRGLGRSMLRFVCQRLMANQFETLRSHCHLANTISFAWHEQNGFVEQPNWLTASIRANHHHLMVVHHEHHHRLTEAAHHRQEAHYWFERKHRWQEIDFARFRERETDDYD